MHRLVTSMALFILLALSTAAGAMPFAEALKHVDPQGKYLFYLHGAIIETEGKNATDKRYGTYLYDSIIKHFEDRGLIVIDEVRGQTQPNQYASRITMQVRQLMSAGVPAGSITVSGFSKGGHIALLVASSLNDPGVGYVIMAGCGKNRTARSFDQFLKKNRGARLKGRILSIYASSDLDAGPCQPAIDQSSGDGLTFKEVRMKSSKGHGLFYQPRPEWVDPVAIFAKGGR